MRSVIVVAVLAFAVVGAGGYAITWYAQANETKHAIEQAIAQINEKQKYLTYDAIETSGFPSTVTVSIIKPHFKGRVDQLFNNNSSTPPAQPSPSWEEDALLDGRVSFGVNAFSNKYTMAVIGNWNENSIINGQTATSLHKQTGNFTCSLQFERQSGVFDTLWNFQALSRDPATLAHNFRMLDCNSAGQKAVDSATQAVLSTIGPVRLYVTSEPQKANEKLRFYFEIADMDITPQGDAQLAGYYHAMSPGYELPVAFSSYGKQNIAFDLSYNGIGDWGTNNKNPLVDVISKLDITNQIYNTHASLHLSNTPSGDMRSSTITFRTDAQFSEQYDALVRAIAKGFITKLYTTNDPKFNNYKLFTQKYNADDLYGILYPTIPNFHAMGNVVLALDGTFKGSANSTTGDYMLDQFQASMTPYGLTGKGSLKMVTNVSPQGNMQVSCANCLKMIDDMSDYESRIKTAVGYFNPEKAAGMTINPVQLEGIKKFLASLSAPSADPTDQTTLSYTIVSSSAGVTINGKSMPEILSLYNQYISPTMPPQQPGAFARPH